MSHPSSSGLNPAKWPINNKTAIYLFTGLLLIFGVFRYNSIPKENFPEIKLPQIIVQTIYPGTSPENMENLVTKPIEDQLKNLSGLKKVTSNSFQDFSVIIAEFRTDVEVEKAKQDVKDAVDKAKTDLPSDLPTEPTITDIDVSEIPILYLNISGNYDFAKLKEFAEKMEDQIEGIKEIKRVDIVGAPEKEIEIAVDLFKMQAASISFSDIEMAIKYENLNVTAGTVDLNDEKRQLSIKKEFKDAEEIADIMVNNPHGKSVRLGDIATVVNGYVEQESFARLYGKNVITLNVVKAAGENLINASDKIFALTEKMQKEDFPKDLQITITGDQSEQTRTTLHDLINTIVIGFLLVTVILTFFMGANNAFFVAMSVPLSVALALIVFPTIGFTMNMIVLFAFLLALGIVVDDAIVVIENTHRIFDNGKVPIKEAALKATHEVFLPVLSGTVTTLMPFVPLAFWGGVIGKFMFFLPITLIITLLASLVVAYIINPVFAIDFMKTHDEELHESDKWTRGTTILSIVFGLLALTFLATGNIGLGTFSIFVYLMLLLKKFYLNKLTLYFQDNIWPIFTGFYIRSLDWSLRHKKTITFSVFGLFLLSFVALGIRKPKVVFFPDSEPNFAYVYLNLPVGVDQKYTNEVLKGIEDKVYKALEIDPKTNQDPDKLVSSIISNVTIGATDPQSYEIGNFPNKGKITIAFVKFAERNGKSTTVLLEKVRKAIQDVPGAEITVNKEQGGPPTAKPIVIDITGDNLDSLIATSERLKRFIISKNIGGIAELRSDFQSDKPELLFNLNRERINREGISTGQVAMALRTAVYGKEISRFRDANEDYPINLRVKDEQKSNVDILKNMSIIYRDMGKGGMVREVPLSAFIDMEYQTTYGGIKRKDAKRIITLSSDVITGYNANEVVNQIQSEINNFQKSDQISIKMGGEQEEQKETAAFLGNAFLISVALMFIIIMIQFNSFRRTTIIMSEIVLALIGVFFGIAIFGIEVSIVMVGVGVVALGGIVVRNGILLIEFADVKLKEGLSPHDAIMEAGKARMTPVILTAIAAILGLIPLAVGLNIDFAKLFTEFNPHIFFGGDSVSFWGPLSWTMIYGLFFGTILTLIVVPVFFLISLEKGKKWFNRGYIH